MAFFEPLSELKLLDKAHERYQRKAVILRVVSKTLSFVRAIPKASAALEDINSKKDLNDDRIYWVRRMIRVQTPVVRTARILPSEAPVEENIQLSTANQTVQDNQYATVGLDYGETRPRLESVSAFGD